MNDLNVFSTRLKELRLSKKLTQPALGEIVGLKKQTINDLEHSRGNPSIFTAIALADYFNVSLDYLVGRSDDPTRH